jgi:phage terminase large subunit GpA-like protein
MTTTPPPAERDSTKQPEHEKVAAIPDAFYVSCPDCGDTLTVQLQEQNDGSFESDPSEAFMECHCGKLIEVTGRWRNLP